MASDFQRRGTLLGKNAEMCSHKFGVLGINRAGMGLFLGHTETWKVFKQHAALDFKLARQLVNANVARRHLSEPLRGQ
ncbi:MAG: hypothetical protein WA581_06730 [Candidatus Acidiferrales bacterium]